MMVLGLVGIAILVVLLASANAFLKHHGTWKVLWRLISGMHLDGHRRTDAGWLRHGQKVMHPTGHASRYAHLPHLYRAGIRWAIGLTLASLMVGLLVARTLTVIALVIGGVLAIAVNTAMAGRKLRHRQHMRATVRPTASALAQILDVSPAVADSNLAISPGYARAKSGQMVAQLVLPDAFAANPGQRASIEHLIGARLGIEVNHAWNIHKRPMTLVTTRKPIPPKMVRFSDMLPEIRELGEHQIMLGITGDATRMIWDQQADEPHMLGAAQTRRGKTSLAMLVIAQTLRHRGRAIVVDPKRVGFTDFLAGHPVAEVYDEPREVEASMWAPIFEFHRILNERIDAYKCDRTVQFERLLLVIDEISMWSNASKVYWDQNKPSKAKATPPVFFALNDCLYAGAQFRMNVLVFGQVLGHAVLGNAIECFGLKALGGFTKQSYMRLIGITPVPVSQKARGRFLIYDGGDYPVWAQTVYGEAEELRDYALEPYEGMPGVPRRIIAAKAGDIERMTA